ncbi:MAG: 50S ribosomal protein L4 [Phycisphaeraceae bacterium]|nr:MAG: 50S ribosomal protein L4 [Phycisphaeraceae bacterium]
MDVPVYNMKGQEVGQISIDEAALGERINPALIKQAYVRYHANLRQGSARSKTRGEVAGSGIKIYRQKGTGRGRHGDKRPPQFRGGGDAFAKKRRREDFHLDMPKKMRRKANRNALLAKLLDSEVRVVDEIKLDKPSTKGVVDMLGALKVDNTALLALSPDVERSGSTRLSARNIDGLTLCRADQLTCFELLNHRYLVIEKGELEAWLAGPSGQTDKQAKIEPKGQGAGAREARKPRPKRGHEVKQQARAARKAGKPAAAGSEGEG